MSLREDRKQETHLNDYWRILVRRRYLIATCILVTTLAALVSSILAIPVYRSTCQIKIERAGTQLVGGGVNNTGVPGWLDYQAFYRTQYQIIQSESVLREAVQSLDLPNRPQLVEGNEKKSKLSLGAIKALVVNALIGEPEIDPDVQQAVDADPLRPFVGMLKGGVTVSPIRDSHLVDISFSSTSPVFAAEAANEIANAYRNFTLSEKKIIAEQSSDWLLARISEMKKKIAEQEFSLQQYAREQGIGAGDAGDSARDSFNDLRKEHLEAQVEVENKRALLTRLQASPAESLQEVRSHPAIMSLTQSIATLERQYEEAKSTYGPEYVDVINFGDQLRSARQRMGERTREIADQIIAAARADLNSANRKMGQLANLLEGQGDRVEALEEVLVEYDAMKFELDRDKATYQELIKRRSSMDLAQVLGDTAHNVVTLDKAQVPRGHYRPKRTLNVFLGMIFGTLLGIGAAILMEYVDNTLKTPDDVRDVLGTPVMGLIPSHDIIKQPKRDPDATDTQLDAALITANVPLSPIAESYRELRTGLLLATPGHPPRDIAITSCQPSEGKTTTALNLAIALAQLGRRVLVVDTDLRRPRCHQVLEVYANQGVSNFLAGMDDIDALVQDTGVERLQILPAGPVPPNPAELLDSPRFAELVSRLREHGYDHVIYDSPPVLSVVDPLLIGRHTDGTVLVIRSAYTKRETGRLGAEKLVGGRVNLLGVVLNAVKSDHVPYQYRYYRYGYSRDGEKRPQGGGRKRVRKGRAVAGGSKQG